jgi:hypothetical protein
MRVLTVWLELHVHAEQVGAEDAHVDRVESTQRMPADDAALTGERVVFGQDRGDPRHPAIPQADAQPYSDPWIVLNVADVSGPQPVSAMIQNELPLRPLPTGVRRDRPDVRPRVSRIARPSGLRPIASSARMSGLMVHRCKVRTIRTLIRRLRAVTRSRAQ